MVPSLILYLGLVLPRLTVGDIQKSVNNALTAHHGYPDMNWDGKSDVLDVQLAVNAAIMDCPQVLVSLDGSKLVILQPPPQDKRETIVILAPPGDGTLEIYMGAELFPNINTSFPLPTQNIIGVGWAWTQGDPKPSPDVKVTLVGGRFSQPILVCK